MTAVAPASPDPTRCVKYSLARLQTEVRSLSLRRRTGVSDVRVCGSIEEEGQILWDRDKNNRH